MQDYIESQALYDMLEKDIVPLFYDRGRDGIPHNWIAKMKNSIRDLSPEFNTHRMVREYTENYYIPARDRYLKLTQPDISNGLSYVEWWKHVTEAWDQVAIKRVETSGEQLKVGDDLEVHAWIKLGPLSPDEVKVQLYYGRLDTEGMIAEGEAVDMIPVGNSDDGTYEFSVTLAYDDSGERGLSVRVMPDHPYLNEIQQLTYIHWAAE